MNQLWGKLIKKNKTLKQLSIEIKDVETNRKREVENAISEICSEFDLERPMWLSDNEKDFNQFNKTAFTSDHFIEEISFDRLEIELIIEKKKKNKK